MMQTVCVCVCVVMTDVVMIHQRSLLLVQRRVADEGEGDGWTESDDYDIQITIIAALAAFTL